MRWQLRGPWPVGQWCVPDGAIIDGANPRWNNIALPLPLPLNVISLDQSAYDQMILWYSQRMTDDFLHLLHYGQGVRPVQAKDLPLWLSIKHGRQTWRHLTEERKANG
jgi:hypothetical protein